MKEGSRQTKPKTPLEEDYYPAWKGTCKVLGIDEPSEVELWSKKPNPNLPVKVGTE
jgi:hypothetical protein